MITQYEERNIKITSEIIFTTENGVSLYNGQVLVYILRVYLITLQDDHESRWDDGVWVAEICRHHSYSTQTLTVVNLRHWQCTNHQVVIYTYTQSHEVRREWADQIKKGEIEAQETTETSHI